MQFVDPVKWSEQEMELNSTEAGRKMLTFLIDWFTAAEDGVDDLGWGDDDDVVAQAMREALAELEEERGHLSLEWIGQMLFLAREHWVHGQDLMGGLTVIEHRTIQIFEVLQLADQAESAKL